MLRFIVLQEGRAHENVEHYRDRSFYYNWKHNLQIMQNNVETQHKHMYSLYIGSLCNEAFPVTRFTCIVTSQCSWKSECDEA